MVFMHGGHFRGSGLTYFAFNELGVTHMTQQYALTDLLELCVCVCLSLSLPLFFLFVELVMF